MINGVFRLCLALKVKKCNQTVELEMKPDNVNEEEWSNKCDGAICISFSRATPVDLITECKIPRDDVKIGCSLQ